MSVENTGPRLRKLRYRPTDSEEKKRIISAQVTKELRKPDPEGPYSCTVDDALGKWEAIFQQRCSWECMPEDMKECHLLEMAMEISEYGEVLHETSILGKALRRMTAPN